MSLEKKEFLESLRAILCKQTYYLITSDAFYFPALSIHDLDLPRLDSLLPYKQAGRNTEEVGVGELLTRARVTVVVQNLNPCTDEILIQGVGVCGCDITWNEGYEMDAERSNGFGPHNAFLIGKNLYQRSHETSNTDAIGTKDDRLLLSTFLSG